MTRILNILFFFLYYLFLNLLHESYSKKDFLFWQFKVYGAILDKKKNMNIRLFLFLMEPTIFRINCFIFTSFSHFCFSLTSFFTILFRFFRFMFFISTSTHTNEIGIHYTIFFILLTFTCYSIPPTFITINFIFLTSHYRIFLCFCITRTSAIQFCSCIIIRHFFLFFKIKKKEIKKIVLSFYCCFFF